MIIENNKLLSEPTDNFQVNYVHSPNFYSTLIPTKIVIHYTESPDAKSAIDTFKQEKKPSAHLIISRDGSEVTQMVPFHKKAKHTIRNNTGTIGIELSYPGYLSKKAHPTHFKHVSHFAEDKRLNGYYIGAERYEIWPLFPIEQLETLFQVCKKLIEEFPSIDTILGHAELEQKPDPGPAFPMTYFREKLLGNKIRGRVLKDVSQPVVLRTGPGQNYPVIAGGNIAQNKGVAVFDDQDREWAMVEVMEPENGNQWQVGWIPKANLLNRKYQVVIEDHMLLAKDEDQSIKQFEYIPIPSRNFGLKMVPETKIQYLIMHYTAATSMRSTINHFTDKDSIVSAHLLIGRDGSIVQFVPFNVEAYHCGYSYWEELDGINHYSIGIELVNGGHLKPSAGGHFKSGREVIPDDQIEEDVHWKSFSNKPRSWQTYTPIQLEVAKDVAKAIIEKYDLKDILGHDEINLKEKTDPGPLFPIEDWRQEIFGRAKPEVQKWKVNQNDLAIYVNQDYKPPHPNHKIYPQPLKKNNQFFLEDRIGSWLLIRAGGRWGWIRNRSYSYKITNSNTGKGKIISNKVTFYKRWNSSKRILPPIEHRSSPLPIDLEVRIQTFKNEWALIANIPGNDYFEGWVKKGGLEKVE